MIRQVARRLEPMAPSTPGSAVYDRFEREPDTLVIAVVDADDRPVGLIERNNFFLRMAADYGRALYAGRPISIVMDRAPIIAEAATPLDSFLASAMQTSAGALLHGFIVVEAGRYLGVGTALDLLIGAFQENVRRGSEMADLADQRLQATLEAEEAVKALAAARDAAESANRAKGEFLANMSHEIRTPLNGVLGVASALGRTSLTARQREMVRLIETSADSLQVVLADVLDLARVEAGRLDISAEPTDLRKTAASIVELFRAKAEEKGLQLSLQVSRSVANRHLGDAVRLKQILGNLLSNAVKFTAAGFVRLAIEASAAKGSQELTFVVEDSGIGFDAKTGERLFNRFAQADGSVTRRFGGAGLGLAISSELAGLMGGSIKATSTPGVGSRFVLSLSLPIVAANQAPASHPAQAGAKALAGAADEAGRALRILVAEDHEVNRRVVQLIFEGLDVELTMAEDGVQAIERFAAARFDLVLMDMQMPRMGGLEAIAAIRAREAAQRLDRTPILMLTANALPEHESDGRAAGADGFLTKPIAAADLLEAAQRALSAPAKAAAA